jgi:asparagine synthase (glutamine-hydrolysing)
MCGIAGQMALREDATARVDTVSALLKALRHRGPDDEGLFADSTRRVCLGMRRLSIIDLRSGQQPVYNEDGRVACVFNGEIYNFGSLRAELVRRGHVFKSVGDSEVIVHLYEEEGAACLSRLRGMFALAIWDGRRETLLLARDRLGKKPLYYGVAHGRLSFASEIGALYRVPDLRGAVDPAALDLYLTYGYVPAPFSIFTGIRKLPAAHALRVEGGVVRAEPYWRLDDHRPLDGPPDEIGRALLDRLTEAVDLRLISDVPLGCFLSGGVDSSSVVALMSRRRRGVKTFSIGFKETEFNELSYAREVATLYHTDHHEFIVEPHLTEALPDLARHFGEPFADSSALPTWYLSALTAKHVTVALNGDGGDELFGGYPWYRTAQRLARLARRVPRPVAWAASRALRGDGARTARARRLAGRLLASPAERFRSLRTSSVPAVRARLYSPRLRHACDDAANRYLEDVYNAIDADDVARMLSTDLLSYVPEDLMTKVDRMTMAHSIESRSPFLDHELVEFAVRIPATLKWDEHGGKAILRRVMGPAFPPGFLERPKRGFSIPVDAWLRGELRGPISRKICGPALLDHGWFDPGAVRAMCEEHWTGRHDWGAELWALMMLAEFSDVAGVAGSVAT